MCVCLSVTNRILLPLWHQRRKASGLGLFCLCLFFTHTSVGCVLCPSTTHSLLSAFFSSFASFPAFHLSLATALSSHFLDSPLPSSTLLYSPSPHSFPSRSIRLWLISWNQERGKEKENVSAPRTLFKLNNFITQQSNFLWSAQQKKVYTIPHITSFHSMPPPMPVDDNIWNLNRYLPQKHSIVLTHEHLSHLISSHMCIDFNHPNYIAQGYVFE